MTTVKEIAAAIRRLPKRDLASFRKWFAEFDAKLWDLQIQEDVAAGRLDKLAREALRDHKAGRTTDL
jgi:hypothetical protein